jgi:hypothetical protein
MRFRALFLLKHVSFLGTHTVYLSLQILSRTIMQLSAIYFNVKKP